MNANLHFSGSTAAGHKKNGPNPMLLCACIFIVQAFFVAMLVVPTTFQVQRGVVLVGIIAVASVVALSRWRVHREIMLLSISTLVVGIFGITWGVVNDAPGALRVMTVYFLWPIIYLLFIGLAHSLAVMRKMEVALLLGISIATTMAFLVLIAGILGYGDIVFPLLSFQDAGFGHYEGFTEFRIFNLSTVMYGFPFVFSLLISRQQDRGRGRKAWLWFILVLMVVVAVGSGRRMFWLLVLLTPFFALFFIQVSVLRLKAIPMLNIIIKMVILALLAGIGMISMFGLQLVVLAQQFIAAFLGEEESSGIRHEQAEMLWNAFAASPIIGHGLGSTVDMLRSTEQPWAYELSYLALLMNVGLVGIIIYGLAIGWIFIKGIQLSRKSREFAKLFVPLVTALAAFLVMNATNPYLSKFDYLWVIFLPAALINAYLTRRSSNA